MENFPTPMFETERTGLGRECEASLAVAAMQSLFILDTDDSGAV